MQPKRNYIFAKDPICGSHVHESIALRVERDGETFFFCGSDCRHKFLVQSFHAMDDHNLAVALHHPAPLQLLPRASLHNGAEVPPTHGKGLAAEASESN
ncbi:MAG: YHS domain-containing protein [Planctomycetota bacterium]